MSRSELIIQRDQSMMITPGDGREELVSLARWCGQLRSIVAGSYVYEVTPIVLWGAAARGITAARLLGALDRASSTPLPASFTAQISQLMGRYGVLRLESEAGITRLCTDDPTVLRDLNLHLDDQSVPPEVPPGDEGRIKLAAANQGWPIADRRSLDRGSRLDIGLQPAVRLRDYQRRAVSDFMVAGSGLILLPCGAGKTVTGVAAACEVKRSVLVLTPSRNVAEQWQAAFRQMTTAADSQIVLAGSGQPPGPITVATYHSATRSRTAGNLVDHPWGLVIYDEVQSLPADVFRLSAAFQSSRRLGLTATLVREDGRERDIFALVGPPVFDVPWVQLEHEGWIAPARCAEVHVPEPSNSRERLKFKLAVLGRLLHRHAGDAVLVIGSDLRGLETAAGRFDLPLVTGKTPVSKRQERYQAFRDGRIQTLVLSKVGSVGIDLPQASVMIQLSGTFGSRQEEAQRVGRLLRPGPGKTAMFYSVVARGTNEERYARKRQRFLVDQGYQYEIIEAADLPRPAFGR